MKTKLIICRGCPASGKSTYSKQWVLEDPKKRVRVNRDDIRLMLGKYWVPSREHLVTDIEWDSTIKALNSGYDVILDSTNLEHYTSLHYRWNCFDYTNKVTIEFKDFFDISFEELIRRDSERTELKVGEEVIRRFYDKQLKIIENEQ
jgi:predicted kinase